MANASISFFLQCSENGSILRTFWHSPACLISAYQKNLKELFAANERSKLEAFLQESFAGRQELFHQGTFRLLSPETDISIFIMKYSDSCLSTDSIRTFSRMTLQEPPLPKRFKAL